MLLGADHNNYWDADELQLFQDLVSGLLRSESLRETYLQEGREGKAKQVLRGKRVLNENQVLMTRKIYKIRK